MTAGWGVDAHIENGVPTSGTTSQDVRKVWGALYTPGVITGAVVTPSATAMSYSISAGVVAIRMSTGEVVMAPVAATTLPVPAAPATGTRLDIIYVRQRTPSTDSNADVVVDYGTSVPARAQEISRFLVSAGNASASKAVRQGNIDYSIPYGASLGRLHYWQDKSDKNLTTSSNITRQGNGTIHLPTDRMVTFKYSNVLSARNAAGFDNGSYCEYGFLPSIDGKDMLMWTTGGLHQSWQFLYFEHTQEVKAGTHTVNIGVRRASGPGTGWQHYGVDPQGFGRSGAEFTVMDAGPVK